jgi:hypothetical protein
MLQDILTKQGFYILTEENEAYTDEEGHIYFFKTREEADKFMQKQHISGIIK